jgi:hypothetical protein
LNRAGRATYAGSGWEFLRHVWSKVRRVASASGCLILLCGCQPTRNDDREACLTVKGVTIYRPGSPRELLKNVMDLGAAINFEEFQNKTEENWRCAFSAEQGSVVIDGSVLSVMTSNLSGSLGLHSENLSFSHGAIFYNTVTGRNHVRLTISGYSPRPITFSDIKDYLGTNWRAEYTPRLHGFRPPGSVSTGAYLSASIQPFRGRSDLGVGFSLDQYGNVEDLSVAKGAINH